MSNNVVKLAVKQVTRTALDESQREVTVKALKDIIKRVQRGEISAVGLVAPTSDGESVHFFRIGETGDPGRLMGLMLSQVFDIWYECLLPGLEEYSE